MKKFLLALTVFFLSLYSSFAQVPPPPDYQENSGPGASPLPLDQYVFVLVGIALSIGVYFMWTKRKAFN